MNFLRLLIIILITTLANSVFAKPLPPGTGSSVPANILFLVDKSQSMWDPASGPRKDSDAPSADTVTSSVCPGLINGAKSAVTITAAALAPDKPEVSVDMPKRDSMACIDCKVIPKLACPETGPRV